MHSSAQVHNHRFESARRPCHICERYQRRRDRRRRFGANSWYGGIDQVSTDSQEFEYHNGVMTLIDRLGGTYGIAFDINSQGQVAGVTRALTGKMYPQAARYNSPSTGTGLGTFGGDESFAYGVNDKGQVVGFAEIPPVGNQTFLDDRAFLYDNGQMKNLGTLGGDTSEAFAINNNGVIVGQSEVIPKATIYEPDAFMYVGGQMIDIHPYFAFPFTPISSRAWDINNFDQVVGTADFGSNSRGFLYDHGVATDLGTLGGHYARALAINDSGQIVGDSAPRLATPHFFTRTGR